MRNGYFWCISNGWTSHDMYWQCLAVIKFLSTRIFDIQSKNDHQTNIVLYWPFLTTKIPERWIVFDAHPLTELCTMFQATFEQFTRLLLLFVAKHDPSKTHVGCIYHSWQQNNLGDGTFFMFFQWVSCVSFPNSFEK